MSQNQNLKQFKVLKTHLNKCAFLNKMLKNSEKIFSGGDRGPPKPPFLGKKGGFGNPCHPPKIFVFAIFQHLIHLFGVSVFWRAFTGYFTLTLSHFMMFFVKLGFLVENLVILYSEVRPKRAFFQMRFRNLKWLQILVLRHLPQYHFGFEAFTPLSYHRHMDFCPKWSKK